MPARTRRKTTKKAKRSTKASRSAAAKKAARTRKANAAKRSRAAKKAAATRKRNASKRSTAAKKAATTRKRKTTRRKSTKRGPSKAKRSAAAKKAWRTRRRNAAKRSTAAKKAAKSRRRKTTRRKSTKRAAPKRKTTKRRTISKAKRSAAAKKGWRTRRRGGAKRKTTKRKSTRRRRVSRGKITSAPGAFWKAFTGKLGADETKHYAMAAAGAMTMLGAYSFFRANVYDGGHFGVPTVSSLTAQVGNMVGDASGFPGLGRDVTAATDAMIALAVVGGLGAALTKTKWVSAKTAKMAGVGAGLFIGADLLRNVESLGVGNMFAQVEGGDFPSLGIQSALSGFGNTGNPGMGMNNAPLIAGTHNAALGMGPNVNASFAAANQPPAMTSNFFGTGLGSTRRVNLF